MVNKMTNRILGVVGRDYRLVTNREALDRAIRCCQAVFPETEPGEWAARSTDAPSTGGHCLVGLAHRSSAFVFKFVAARDRLDAVVPFIRVTNSCNGQSELAPDIGFLRKVCKDGLILPRNPLPVSNSTARSGILANESLSRWPEVNCPI